MLLNGLILFGFATSKWNPACVYNVGAYVTIKELAQVV